MSDLSIRAQIRNRFPPSVLARLDKNQLFLSDAALDIHNTISNRTSAYLEDMNKQRAFLSIWCPEQKLAQSIVDETPTLPIPQHLDLRPVEDAYLWHSLSEQREDHVITMVAAFKPYTSRGKDLPNYQTDRKYRRFLPHLPVIVEAEPFGFSSNPELVSTLKWVETHDNFQGFLDMFATMARAQGTVADDEQAQAAFKQGMAALVWITYQAHCLQVKQSYIGYMLFFRMLHLLQSTFPGEIWHSVRFDFNRFWAWIQTIEKRFEKKRTKKNEMDRQAVMLVAKSKLAAQGSVAKDAHEDDWAYPLRKLLDSGVGALQKAMDDAAKDNRLMASSANFPRTPMLHHLLEKIKVLEKAPEKVVVTAAVNLSENGGAEFHTHVLDVKEDGTAAADPSQSVPHTPICFDS